MDRASEAGLSSRAWWSAVIYIAAAAMFLRFYDLELKPLHHDEGVNTLFLTSLVRPPHTYRYDPANYHGPTLYYLGWMSAALLGLTTVAIRVVTAAAGLAAVLLPLALRREIGAVGVLVAASILALSPGAVYFSRYFIHEMPLVCFTIATAVAVASWWRDGSRIYLCLAAAAAGLVFATKETAVISAVVMTAAAIGAPIVSDLRYGRLGLPRAWIGELRERIRPLPVVLAVCVFVAVNLLFYTSFLTHWQGAIDALKSFAIWTHTGTTAHTRPWDAYLGWLAAEELLLLLIGGAGTAAALWRADNRFAVFAALWAAGMLTAYSVIPYKTPWLVLNVLAPLALTAGYLGDLVWRNRRLLPRPVLVLAAAVVAAGGAYQTVALNFFEYDDGKHPYVYVHTSREIFGLVREIERIQAVNPGATIAVTSPDHFPLSWYLRALRVGYYGKPTVTNDPVVVGSEEQQPALDASLGERYKRIGSYRLRPGVQLVLYMRDDLRRPIAQPLLE